MKPAIPAATFKCPKFDFTLPSAHEKSSDEKANNLNSFYSDRKVVPLFEKVVHMGSESLTERELNEIYQQAGKYDVQPEVHQADC